MRKIATTALVGAVATTLLLAGCAPDATTPPTSATPSDTATPTQKPTDEPVTTPEPESEEDAIDAAVDAVNTFLVVRAEIETQHPEDSSKIDTVATGDEAAFVKESARLITKKGQDSEGTYSYEVWDGWEAVSAREVDDKSIEFGSVSLTGCFDSSKIVTQDSDGNVIKGNPIRRAVIVSTVVYDPTDGTWLVASMKQHGDEVEEC